jgi:hypothetical protein
MTVDLEYLELGSLFQVDVQLTDYIVVILKTIVIASDYGSTFYSKNCNGL